MINRWNGKEYLFLEELELTVWKDFKLNSPLEFEFLLEEDTDDLGELLIDDKSFVLLYNSLFNSPKFTWYSSLIKFNSSPNCLNIISFSFISSMLVIDDID